MVVWKLFKNDCCAAFKGTYWSDVNKESTGERRVVKNASDKKVVNYVY